ncbi:unnamed protein product [Cunninghamella echinulata]
MLHSYKPTEVATCLNHSLVLYIGDSIVRQQFFAFSQLIHQNISLEGEKHSDRRYVFQELGLMTEFWWDPYLNDTRTLDLLSSSSKGLDQQQRPSLLVLGAGSWHMRYLETDDYFYIWQKTMDNVFDAVTKSTSAQPSSTIADAVILSPIEIPQYELFDTNRSLTITEEKISSMNQYLYQKNSILHPTTPFAIPFSWNQMIKNASQMTEDGLHYNSVLSTAQVQLALNYRCNDVQPKHFPYDTTCCFRYPRPRWYQNIFFIIFLVLVPLGFYFSSLDMVPTENILNALFIFGLCVIYMYFGDRTQIFGKIHKHFDEQRFTYMMVVLVVITGIVTLKKSKKEGDLGFLNRDQTDEWKGWMQVIILIYHFMGASGTSGIYNAVRILVAAYLFQTGYGHFFFFYKKGDFGIERILNVMVRLNLLTFVLQYLMDTDYLSYYFTPLVSFWFGVIYITMYIGHSNNKNTSFLLIKIGLAALITTVFIETPGILEAVFDVLSFLFNIQWNAKEWRFRLALDGWIVYVGMLSAFAYIKCLEYKWMDHPLFPRIKLATLVTSSLALTWYFWFEITREDKFVYNEAQPYISWIPILAFIFLRNATLKLRNTSSKFFIFIGKISLETFIGQFHMWLAGDTKGLLIILPNLKWVTMTTLGWYTNLIFSTILFIFVCYYLSQTTTELTKWICKDLLMAGHSTNATGTSREAYQPIPLLPTGRETVNASVIEGNNKIPSESNHQEMKNGSSASSSSTSTTTEPSTIVNINDTNENDDSPDLNYKPSILYRFVMDPRMKSILFLLIVGLLNRFC